MLSPRQFEIIGLVGLFMGFATWRLTGDAYFALMGVGYGVVSYFWGKEKDDVD